MKVALCLSGQTRTWKHTFSSLKQHILDQFTPDVFIHTWTHTGNKIPNVDQMHEFAHNVELIDSSFVELYTPTFSSVELPDYGYFKSIADNLIHTNERFYNQLMMYYSIYKANQLKCEYERRHNFTYDVVIRCRFDSYFHYVNIDHTLPFLQNIIYLAPNQNHGQFFTNEMKKELFLQGIRYMPNDQFAYSSSRGMDYYSNLYLHIIQPDNKYGTHPEGLLSNYLWESSCPFSIQVNEGIIKFLLRENLHIHN